jgi:hypothetical protein
MLPGLSQNQVSSRKCWFDSDRGHHRFNSSGPAFYRSLCMFSAFRLD